MTTTDTVATFEDWLRDYRPYREQRAEIYESLMRILGVLQGLQTLPGLTDDDCAVIRRAIQRWLELCDEITQI